MLDILWLIFLFSCAFLAYRELNCFYKKINQQVYEDIQELVQPPFTFKEFAQKSRLQPTNSKLNWLIFPLILSLWFLPSSISVFIFILLIYLSFIDANYLLVDFRAVLLVFCLAIIKGFLLNNSLVAMMVVSIFFSLLHMILYLLQKNVFGAGDSLTIFALSPLLNLEQILWLIFVAAIFGLIIFKLFALFNNKIIKLPFVPCIALAFFVVEILKVPAFFGVL